MTKYIYYIILCLQLLPATGYCQPAKASEFSLIYLSNDISYDARKLQTEISSQKSLDDVKRLVRKKITDTKGTIVVVYKVGQLYYRWERRMSVQPEESTDEWIVLGGRGSGLKVLQLRHFADIFTNKVVIIDTMAISVTLQNHDYTIKEFMLKYSCGEKEVMIPIPVINEHELIITQDLFANCGETIDAELVHKEIKGSLAQCRFLLPSSQLKYKWLMMAKGLKDHSPFFNLQTVTGYMETYIRKTYGNCNFDQLYNWLSKQL